MSDYVVLDLLNEMNMQQSMSELSGLMNSKLHKLEW